MSTKQSITQAQASSEPNKRAVWSTQEEQALVSALSERKAQAGDGMNFKPAVWNAIAAEVGSVKGAAKTGDICKTKWGRIKEAFVIVDPLTNLSGIPWTPETGLSLTDDTPSDLKQVWKDYVAKHPKASPYGEKGWALYDNVKLLMPNLAKGKKAYQANGIGPGEPAISGSTEAPAIAMGSSGDVGMVPRNSSEHNNLDDLTEHDNLDNSTCEPQPPPTSPPPSESSLSMNTSKRRFSAVENPSNTSTVRSLSQPSRAESHPSTSHASSASTSAKRGRLTGAIALTSIGHGIADLNASYRRGLELDEARHLDRLSRRDRRDNTISEAVERALQLEIHLLPDVLAALIEILEENEGSAKAYLAISIESVRKAWVRRKLAKIGVAVDDTVQNDASNDAVL